MHDCLFTSVTQISLNWHLELVEKLPVQWHPAHKTPRGVPGHFHRLPVMIMTDNAHIILFPHSSCNFTWILGTIIPYHTPVTNLDCVLQYTLLPRERAMPESVVLQGVTLVLCWDHSVPIHAILCCMYLPY